MQRFMANDQEHREKAAEISSATAGLDAPE